MRKISIFLAASAALLVAACGHQPSASQQTVQVAEPSQQIQLAAANPAPSVQLAAATVDEDNRPFAPDELGGVPEGTSIAELEAAQDAGNADSARSFHDRSMAESRANANRPRRYAVNSMECFVLRQQYSRAVQEGTLHTNSAAEIATAEACFPHN